jgi:hypothetical protein
LMSRSLLWVPPDLKDPRVQPARPDPQVQPASQARQVLPSRPAARARGRAPLKFRSVSLGIPARRRSTAPPAGPSK